MEQVTGKRGRAFDFIIFESYRNVLVKVKRSQTSFTYALEILHQLPAGDREPSPCGLNMRYRPGILGQVSQRDMAVLPDPARFRPGDPRRWRYIPRESLPVKTVDPCVIPDDGTNDPVFPAEERE